MRPLLQVVLLALCACECGGKRPAAVADAGVQQLDAATPAECPPGMTHCPGHGFKRFDPQ